MDPRCDHPTPAAAAAVFDQSHSVRLAEAKAEFLRGLLPEIMRATDLRTALDVGCGFGYFSTFLREQGFAVQGIDVRPENVAEAALRYPEIGFAVRDLEDTPVTDLGQFDLVLCLGLLYHLENPFSAVRNLFAMTRKVCIIETMVAPFSAPLVAFVEEGDGQDQGRKHLAQIPSESWFLKVLCKAGFPYVYGLSRLPAHPDFHRSFLRKRRRTFFVASRVSLAGGALRLVAEPRATGRFMWYSFGVGRLLEQPVVRRALKAGMRRLPYFAQGRPAPGPPGKRDGTPR
jgi:SAM-dependent methyltransferase